MTDVSCFAVNCSVYPFHDFYRAEAKIRENRAMVCSREQMRKASGMFWTE